MDRRFLFARLVVVNGLLRVTDKWTCRNNFVRSILYNPIKNALHQFSQEIIMFGLSKEQTSFQFTNKCPLCNGWPIIPRYIKPDGQKTSALNILWLMDRDTVAECPKCNQRWRVFAARK